MLNWLGFTVFAVVLVFVGGPALGFGLVASFSWPDNPATRDGHWPRWLSPLERYRRAYWERNRTP